jgi:hypothetical protein
VMSIESEMLLASPTTSGVGGGTFDLGDVRVHHRNVNQEKWTGCADRSSSGEEVEVEEKNRLSATEQAVRKKVVSIHSHLAVERGQSGARIQRSWSEMIRTQRRGE